MRTEVVLPTVWLGILVTLLQIAGGEICFRKHYATKNACKRVVKHHHQVTEADDCCSRGYAGYAKQLTRHKNSRKLYECTPCKEASWAGKDAALKKGSAGLNAVYPEKKAVNVKPQPTKSNAAWTDWSDWGPCSKTCEMGIKRRTRFCLNGKCVGEDMEEMPCQEQAHCALDGRFSDWSEWGQCSVSCGVGEATRTRLCNNPAPAYGGLECEGDTIETKECVQIPCPVKGGWSPWLEWGTCSVTCGKGTRLRRRACDNPKPEFGGMDCEGPTSEVDDCILDPCAVNGNWSDWSDWSTCSVTCDIGIKTRTRSCDNPRPQYGGSDCRGNGEETQPCEERTRCPIDGAWSEWSSWGICIARPCSGQVGYRDRVRTCNNPQPQYGGKRCGDLAKMWETQTDTCYNMDGCTNKINGGWCDKEAWGDCQQNGLQTRIRKCECPPPLNGGGMCTGDEVESRVCMEEEEKGSHEREESSGCNIDGSDVGCDQEEDDQSEEDTGPASGAGQS